MSQVVALRGASPHRSIVLGDAIAEFLSAGDFQPSTVEVYERTLEGLLEDLGADVALERISRARLETHLRDRNGTAAPTTCNRNLATIGSLFRGRGHRRDRRRQPRNSRRRSEATP
jgi:hypothetical protein